MAYIFRFIVFFSFINVNLVFCQNQGVVTDAQNSPLDNVNVFFVDQKIILKSNGDGIFIINDDVPNNSYIEFYKLGYSSKIFQYNIDKPVEVSLEKLHIELDEIGIHSMEFGASIGSP